MKNMNVQRSSLPYPFGLERFVGVFDNLHLTLQELIKL